MVNVDTAMQPSGKADMQVDLELDLKSASAQGQSTARFIDSLPGNQHTVVPLGGIILQNK